MNSNKKYHPPGMAEQAALRCLFPAPAGGVVLLCGYARTALCRSQAITKKVTAMQGKKPSASTPTS